MFELGIGSHSEIGGQGEVICLAVVFFVPTLGKPLLFIGKWVVRRGESVSDVN